MRHSARLSATHFCGRCQDQRVAPRVGASAETSDADWFAAASGVTLASS